MEEALVLLEQYQAWVYLAFGLASLIYLRLTLKRFGDVRRAVFGLERERALGGLRRAGAILALTLAGWGAMFVLATFVSPAMPASARPTPIPTVSLLATPSTPGVGGLVAATPLAGPEIDTSGCLNSQATLTSPDHESTVSGVVEIRGTASIPSFAFYRLEFLDLAGGFGWQAVSAGTQPVVDDRLGEWDTTLLPSGDYAFRLVVTDTAGNAPLPCAIRVRVLSGP